MLVHIIQTLGLVMLLFYLNLTSLCLSVHMIYGPLDPVNPHPQFIRLYQWVSSPNSKDPHIIHPLSCLSVSVWMFKNLVVWYFVYYLCVCLCFQQTFSAEVNRDSSGWAHQSLPSAGRPDGLHQRFSEFYTFFLKTCHLNSATNILTN